jgi:hypothetical protein
VFFHLPVLASANDCHKFVGEFSPSARFEINRFVNNLTHLKILRFLNIKKAREIMRAVNFGRAKSTPSNPVSHKHAPLKKENRLTLFIFFHLKEFD